jgi:hypothetical protein
MATPAGSARTALVNLVSTNHRFAHFFTDAVNAKSTGLVSPLGKRFLTAEL